MNDLDILAADALAPFDATLVEIAAKGHHAVIRFSCAASVDAATEQHTTRRGRIDLTKAAAAAREADGRIKAALKAAMRQAFPGRWKTIRAHNVAAAPWAFRVTEDGHPVRGAAAERRSPALVAAQERYDKSRAAVQIRLLPAEREALRELCQRRGWTLREFVAAAVEALS